MTNTHPAQLVFVEDETSTDGLWKGSLLLPRSKVLERRAAFGAKPELVPLDHDPWAIIAYARWKDSYYLSTQGRSKHGRRKRHFKTFIEAQEAACKWAARKYRVQH